MADDNQLGEVVDQQIEQQGTASFKVKDGQVFVFTTSTLEALLAASIENGGKAIVFVKSGVAA